MPELPEVETIRRDLARKIVGQKIINLQVQDHKVAKGNLAKVLIGQKLVRIERRGKLLAFLLANGEYLLVHLKMTGQLIYVSFPPASPKLQRGERKRESNPPKSQIPASAGMTIVAGGHSLGKIDLQVPNKFTRVIFSFSGGGKLYFNDMRRFGFLKIVSQEEKAKIWKNNFGIEPLTKDFKFADFAKLFVKRHTNVKALLLNQKLIAGIGNIYADEVCWCAQILPWRHANKIKTTELKKLFNCINRVLKVAIKNRGTTFNDFVDSEGKHGGHYQFLKVYERDGEKCRRCKNIIKKTRHAGRGTHYCSGCQK